MRGHFFPERYQKHVDRFIGMFVLIAIASAMWFFLLRLLYELSGALASDSLLFLTVGRGILNGLTPWLDLFETKPPGIFLLSAASFALTGTQMLAKVIQVLALLGVALFTFLASLPSIQKTTGPSRRFLMGVAVLFGLLLALYSGDQAGLMMPESYAACGALAYVWLLARDPEFRSWKTIAAGALCFLLAAGFKEPFVLSFFVVAFLLCTPRALVRTFLIPAILAGVLGMLGLLLLGYVHAFFVLYLPHMMGFHVEQNTTSVFLRAFQAGPWLFGNIWGYAPVLAVGFFVLWLEDLVARIKMHAGRERWMAVFIWCVGVYLTLFSIGIGGNFYSHHALFALPLTVVFFLFFLRRHASHEGGQSCVYLVSLSTLFIIAAVTLPLLSRSTFDHQSWKRQESTMRSVASQLDTVMDRCGIDRYLSLIDKGGSPTAFTKHSPYGPLFSHYNRLHEASPRFNEAFGKQLFTEADIIFMRERDNTHLTEYAWSLLEQLFSKEPWDCAKPFQQPVGHTIFFRTASGVLLNTAP